MINLDNSQKSIIALVAAKLHTGRRKMFSKGKPAKNSDILREENHHDFKWLSKKSFSVFSLVDGQSCNEREKG